MKADDLTEALEREKNRKMRTSFGLVKWGSVGDKIPGSAATGTIERASPGIRCNTSGRLQVRERHLVFAVIPVASYK